VKLLVLPLLFYHFERLAPWRMGFIAFLASCALLMRVVAGRLRAGSLAQAPPFTRLLCPASGIVVKNYIAQSQEFVLCAVALAYPVLTFLQDQPNLAGGGVRGHRPELPSLT
jgi:hypothetical protein